MTEHYFSQQPQSKSSPKTWKYEIKDKIYSFTSDVGVFSKNEVDYGSRLLIESFEEPLTSGDFLDLGCGYGPIGITIADRYSERHVFLTDINERALKLAQYNASQNNVQNITIVKSNRFSELNNYRFSAVLTNPPIRAGKKVVHAIFEESHQSLKPGGELWVVIQKKQGAPSAKQKLSKLFDRVDIVNRSKGYHILRAIRSY